MFIDVVPVDVAVKVLLSQSLLWWNSSFHNEDSSGPLSHPLILDLGNLREMSDQALFIILIDN